MASFLENLTQFTPYMPQQPVEAMVNIGMQKQQQYDEGVQKIQDQFTLIAGLPIAKDPVKQHLQQKLNEVKEKVSGGIATDFSNQRLVNNVMSLTKQIASDPIIELGLQNTLRMQNEDERQKAARESGKSSVENDAYYLSKRANWLNDGSIDSTFDATYSEYIDLNKKWFDVLKAMGADSTIEQNPYVKNPDGTINFQKAADMMTEQGLKGITASRIEDAIRATMTEADDRQLRISGWYRFGNVTREGLADIIKKDYETNIISAKKKIEDLKQIKAGASGNSTVSGWVDAEIEKLEQALAPEGKFKQKYDFQLENLMNDPTPDGEIVKHQMYKDGYIAQFANAFSWEEKYLKYLSNPKKEQENWVAEMGLKQAAHALNVSEFEWKQTMDKANLDLDYLKLQQQNAPSIPYFVQRGQSTNIDSPVAAMLTDAETKSAQASQLFNEALSKAKTVDGKPMDPKMFKSLVDAYAKGDDAGEGLPVNIRPLVDKYLEVNGDANAIIATIETVKKQVAESPEFTAAATAIDAELRGRQNIIATVDGKKYTFTPREIVDFLAKRKPINVNLPNQPGVTSGYEYTSNLSNKEKALSQIADRGKLAGKMQDIFATYGDITSRNKTNVSKLNEKVSEFLLPYAANWNPVAYTWNALDAKQKQEVRNITSSTLAMYEEKGGAEGLTKKQQETLRGLINGTKSEELTYDVIVTNGEAKGIEVKGEGEVFYIPLPDELGRQIAPRVGVLPVNSRLRNRLYSGGGTTNITDDPLLAVYPRGFFENVNKLVVNADVNEGVIAGEMLPRLRLKLPNGQWAKLDVDVRKETKGMLNEIDVERWLKVQTDESILNRFIQKYKAENNPQMVELLQKMK